MYDFKFDIKSQYDVNITEKKAVRGVQRFEIKIAFKEKTCPNPVVIAWEYPCKGVFSQWNPALWSARTLNPYWMPIKNKSRSAESAPIQSHISLDNKNVITISLDDFLTPIEISSGIVEETAHIKYKLTLFTEIVNPITEYTAELRIDMRNIPYEKVLSEVSAEWTKIKSIMDFPDASKESMYSTWYSFHQNLSAGEVIKQLVIAKEYGMKTVIVDDGWQTNDNKRGYAYCGDWKPEKISDMKAFVSDIHKLGMKCIVWFSVPFVGVHSKAWKKFEKKYLDDFDSEHPWQTLDPRYPEVRQYLIGIYENAVREWDLDGLKLDFINNIKLTKHSNSPDSFMDCESLEKAIYMLLSEIKEHLNAIKPDIMVEFRQPYIGPAMSRYGNILRVADCPLDLQKNRAGIVDIRLIAGNVAVHSDMLMWNYDDTPEFVALQLINIIFGVPQISMFLDKLSEEHKRVLKFYLSVWEQNKKCLLDGKISAKNPEAGYSLISSENKQTIIAASFIKNIMEIEREYEKIIFLNGSCEKELLIKNSSEKFHAKYTVYDCMGNVSEQGDTIIKTGINVFDVPNSGMLEIHT